MGGSKSFSVENIDKSETLLVNFSNSDLIPNNYYHAVTYIEGILHNIAYEFDNGELYYFVITEDGAGEYELVLYNNTYGVTQFLQRIFENEE